MKIIINDDTKAEFYEADETQAEVIREFLTGSPDSVWRFGYLQGAADELRAAIAELNLRRGTIERLDNGRYKQNDGETIPGTNKRTKKRDKQEAPRT